MWSAFENAFLLCNKEQLADLYYNIGYIFLCSGEMECARRCFRLSLISTGNSSPDALAGLAHIAYYEKDLQKAITFFTVSVSSTGKEEASLETLYNLALCYEEAGDYGNAFKYVQMAAESTNSLVLWTRT